MVDPSPIWSGASVRVPIHLEEAPCFYLGHRSARMEQYLWHQKTRSWRIHADSHHPWPGDLAQRLWLALLKLYDEQGRPEDGRVFYNVPELAGILGLGGASSGSMRARLTVGIEQLDSIRIYVHGAPLAGPAVAPSRAAHNMGRRITAGLDRTPVTLYRLLGGDGVSNFEEEGLKHQLPLFPLHGPRRIRRASMRQFSGYVTESLRGQGGRLVPDFAFSLPPYGLRLVRLLGKRANERPTLTISLESLAQALPAITMDGKPLRPFKLLERLDDAHERLVDSPFLARSPVIADGKITYRFGVDFVKARTLPARDEEWIRSLMIETCRHDHLQLYRRALLTIGREWMRGCLAEARALSSPDDLGENFASLLNSAIGRAEKDRRESRRAAPDQAAG
ncbi:hypothetical protein [Miltoncostaea oceani]|uniref:hypothetical protein n=1 Tax=Miltoncostaea oceani TaxID=2843216 RepID=UPI001C3D1207|nr:hypothetical protein [Miltoncostaea oceani]